MARYYGQGPLTTLMNAGIGVGGNVLTQYIGQKMMQKRLEDMFTKQSEVKTALDMLEGRSPEEYQKVAPVVEQKLQDLGLFKSGLPRTEERIGSVLPPGGGMVTSADQLTPLMKKQYVQPAESLKDITSRYAKDWLASLPEEKRGEVLRSMVAPKDLSSVLALMGLGLKDRGQQDLATHRDRTYGLEQNKLQVQVNSLLQRIADSEKRNQRLTSLEDISSRNRLQMLVRDMELAFKGGKSEDAQRYMDQANAMIEAHPNLGIAPYKLEGGWKIPGLGWDTGMGKRITGGGVKAPGKQETKSSLPDPSKLSEGQTGADTATGKRYKVVKGQWMEIK